ncbi:MAG: hypothetical protein FWD34_09945 [Oscillospiraceae bacterium]|nr:hypothetical protein [Oscillospiraceae bacterium]
MKKLTAILLTAALLLALTACDTSEEPGETSDTTLPESSETTTDGQTESSATTSTTTTTTALSEEPADSISEPQDDSEPDETQEITVAAEPTDATTATSTTTTAGTPVVTTAGTTVATTAVTTAATTAGTPAVTTTQAAPPTPPSGTIASLNSFEAHIASASWNAQTSITLTVSNAQLVSDFYKKFHDDALNTKYGVKKMDIEVATISTQTTVTAEFKLVYQDSVTILNAYRKGSTAGLSANEKAAYDKAVSVANEAKKLNTLLERQVYIHDHLARTVRYGTPGNDAHHTAHSALVNGVAVCEGYANAFKILAEMVGIECILITGEGNNGGGVEKHMWNMVKLNNQWYHVDVTWNKPAFFNGAANTTFFHHKYFNVNDSFLGSTHSWNKSSFPASTATALNYYTVYFAGKTASNKTELSNAFANNYKAGTDTYVFLMTYNFTNDDVTSAIRATVNKGSSVISFDLGGGRTLLTITLK